MTEPLKCCTKQTFAFWHSSLFPQLPTTQANVSQPILGTDFFKANSVTIDFKNGRVSFPHPSSSSSPSLPSLFPSPVSSLSQASPHSPDISALLQRFPTVTPLPLPTGHSPSTASFTLFTPPVLPFQPVPVVFLLASLLSPRIRLRSWNIRASFKGRPLNGPPPSTWYQA